MNEKKYCALTFDDGPSDTTLNILDLLKHYNCTASFFVIGNRINSDLQLDIMKKAVSQGCTIENHSFTHGRLKDMTDEEIMNEYSSTNKIIFDAVGDYPQFFRAPGLSADERLFNLIPLPFAGGSGGSPDWNSYPYEEATSKLEDRISGIMNVAKDGHIILLHDCGRNYLTPAALSVALPRLIDDGFEFVNLRRLFEIKERNPAELKKAHWRDVEKA